jgi:uncharacterized protein with FMN-binding domain
MPETLRSRTVKRSVWIERILAIVAILTLVIARNAGARWATRDLDPYLEQAVPGADDFSARSGDVYAAHQGGRIVAYVAFGQAIGYGGPLWVAVAIDPEGNILNVAVVGHRETPRWYNRTVQDGLIQRLVGKNYADEFVVGSDVDNVTGATYTTRAIATAARNGARAAAEGELGLPAASAAAASAGAAPEAPPVQFGVPEAALMVLFAMGYVNRRPWFKYKKQLRWVSMIVGLVLLGIVYTQPLTLSVVSRFLLGPWPEWQTNLYWYLLLGGMLLFYILENQNAYCEWFCPFGAVQECLGAVGGARPHTGGRYRLLLTWLQRVLAWIALLLALFLRNPGVTSYEIFGTFFDLEGSTLQFVVLGIVLVAALSIRRPWCRFLCPIRPVSDLIRLLRRWIGEVWQSARA